MNLLELYAKISVDDSGFRQSMQNAQKTSKAVASAMKQLESPVGKIQRAFQTATPPIEALKNGLQKFKDRAAALKHPIETLKSKLQETAQSGLQKFKDKTEALRHPLQTLKAKIEESKTAIEEKRNKLSALSSAYESAKKKVSDLTRELNKSAKENGDTSEKTQELAQKLDEAKNEAKQAQKELEDYAQSVTKAGKKSAESSVKVGNLASKLGKGLKVAGKIGATAIGAASTAIIALGKIGLDYNKQIETYTANFKVMMGDSEAAAKKVEELKEMGAKTPFELGDLASATQTLLAFNVSADDSTGVLSKLGDISLGNVQKLESLTRAYGKMNASQKVTLEDINMMIDAGFNPLLIVAEQTGKSMAQVYDDISNGKVSFEQITAAINTATSAGGQFYKGMEEASKTTEGLISTLKDNATALVGEVYMPISEGLTNTVLPAAINAINTLSEAFRTNGVEGMIAAAGEMLGGLINAIVSYAPKIIGAAVSLVGSLVRGISENKESLATGAIQIVTQLATGILNMLPQIIALGLDLIVSLALGIAEALPELMPTIVDIILQIVDTLTAPEQLSQLLSAALTLILELASGLMDAIPQLVKASRDIINNFTLFLMDPKNIAMLLNTALQVVIALCTGLINSIPTLVQSVGELVASMIDKIKNTDWGEVASDVIDGLLAGLKKAWESVKSWFTNAWNSLFGGKKISVDADVTGASKAAASKVAAAINGSHALGLDYVPFNGYIAELHKGERVLTAEEAKRYTSGVTVVQNIYSQAKTAADLMQESVYQQRRAVLIGV